MKGPSLPAGLAFPAELFLALVPTPADSLPDDVARIRRRTLPSEGRKKSASRRPSLPD